MKPKKKKKNKITLHSLFADNRFVLALSIFMAIIFWASVCIVFSPQTEVVIEDVPVNFEIENSVPEQCGLQMFGENQYTVDITVSGSRYVVGGKSLSPKDFKVTALTSNVTSAGTHSVKLRVTKLNDSIEYTIESCSENFLNIYFDQYIEKTVNVSVEVNSDEIVADGYIAGNDYIMDSKTVVVGGPAMEVSQLHSVIASVNIDEPLSSSKAFSASLMAVNENGEPLKYITFDGVENGKMTVTVPVYKMTNLPLSVNFINSPSSYVGNPVSYSCSPSKLNVPVLQNGTTYSSLNVGDIDFSKLKPGENKFTFPVRNINGIKKNSTSYSTVTVTVNMPTVEENVVAIKTDNISIANAPDGKTLKFFNSRINDVVLYGTKSEIDNLNLNDLKAKIDLKNLDIKDGGNELTVPLYIKDTESCWIYGEYNIKFSIK